jgi:hypothetical protein
MRAFTHRHAEKSPARATDAVPWMSSLKVQILLRYLRRCNIQVLSLIWKARCGARVAIARFEEAESVGVAEVLELNEHTRVPVAQRLAPDGVQRHRTDTVRDDLSVSDYLTQNFPDPTDRSPCGIARSQVGATIGKGECRNGLCDECVILLTSHARLWDTRVERVVHQVLSARATF